MTTYRTLVVLVACCSLLLLLAPVSLAHRCYVCLSQGLSADDALQLFPGPVKLQYCEQFRPGDPNFIKECPAEYPGCLTKVQGKNVMRTCSDLSFEIDDCKLANDIQYCYCYGKELCNIGNTTSTAPQHLEDDEDDFPEGSGTGTDDYHKKLHATKAPAPHGTTSSTKDTDGTSQSSSLILPTYRTLLCLILLVALTSL